jgi:hypothetical protein
MAGCRRSCGRRCERIEQLIPRNLEQPWQSLVSERFVEE